MSSVRFKEPTEQLAHWYALVESLEVKPSEFYQELERRIATHDFPNTTVSRVEFLEGGMLSAKREYLRVVRGDMVFDICGAPFGDKNYFVSYWLSRFQFAGCAAAFMTLLITIPGIGAIVERGLRPLTYYQIDTALMFQQAIHEIVLGYVDELTGAQGIEPIPEHDRKPSMKRLTDI